MVVASVEVKAAVGKWVCEVKKGWQRWRKS